VEVRRLRKQVGANRLMRHPVAHRSGELFHLSTCKWAEHIPRKDLVKFASREEALNAGYRPCDQCAS
jgi:micrococcal nuclease